MKCQEAKRYDHAVDAYLHAAAQSENDPDVWLNLGFCYGELKKYLDGVRAYQAGLKLNQSIPWGWRNLAWTYRQLQDIESAAVVLRNAVKELPDVGFLWTDLGWACADLRQYDEASTAARQAINREPLNTKAWYCLGHALQQSGRIDEAIRCFQRISSLDAKDGSVWRRLRECHEKKADNAGVLNALLQLTGCCPTDAEAWNSLGTAHWKQNNFDQALEAFTHAHTVNSQEPVYLSNLGLTFSKLGFLTDAVECFRSALQLKPDHSTATTELQRLEPEVVQLKSSFAGEKVRQLSVAADYLNPFELLDYDLRSLTAWDDAEVRRRKKKLLAEIKLNDGRLPSLDCVVDESSVRQVLDDLDHAERRYYHFLIYHDKPLLRLLSRGAIEFFLPGAQPRCSSPTAQDDGFRAFLRPSLIRQANRVLAEAVKTGQPELVRAFSYRKIPLTSDAVDEFYEGTYQHLHQVQAQIVDRFSSEKTTANELVRFALEEIEELVKPEVLNALPKYFEDVRTDIAKTIRAMSIVSNNDYDDIPTAILLLEVANSISVDPVTAARFREDHETLRMNLRAATAGDVNISIGEVPLRIDREHFVWGQSRFAVKEVTGLRWGVLKQYTNGVRTSCSYLVGVVGQQGRGVEIECHRGGFLGFGRKEADSASNFQTVVRGCLARIAPVLVESFLQTISKGGSVCIGDCVLSNRGVSFSTGVMLWRQDHVVPWATVGCSTGSGQLTVFNKHNPRAAKILNLRNTWNAVLFEFVVESMNARNMK